MRADVPAGEELLSSGDAGFFPRASASWHGRRPSWPLALVVGVGLGLVGGWAWNEQTRPAPEGEPPALTVALGDGYLQGLNEEPREPTAYLDASVINTGGGDLEVVAVRWGGLANRVEQPLPKAGWIGVQLTTPVNCTELVTTGPPDPELPELVVEVRTSDGTTREVVPAVVNDQVWTDIAGQCRDSVDF